MRRASCRTSAWHRCNAGIVPTRWRHASRGRHDATYAKFTALTVFFIDLCYRVPPVYVQQRGENRGGGASPSKIGVVAKREHEGTHAIAGEKIRRNTNFPRTFAHFYSVHGSIPRRNHSPLPPIGSIRIVASINLRGQLVVYYRESTCESFLFATHASHLNTYTDIKCNDCRPFWPGCTFGYR